MGRHISPTMPSSRTGIALQATAPSCKSPVNEHRHPDRDHHQGDRQVKGMRGAKVDFVVQPPPLPIGDDGRARVPQAEPGVGNGHRLPEIGDCLLRPR